jgi:hypothetical protein
MKKSRFFRALYQRVRSNTTSVSRISACSSSKLVISLVNSKLLRLKLHRLMSLKKKLSLSINNFLTKDFKSKLFPRSLRIPSTTTDGENLKELTLTLGNSCRRFKLYRNASSRRQKRSLKKMSRSKKKKSSTLS